MPTALHPSTVSPVSRMVMARSHTSAAPVSVQVISAQELTGTIVRHWEEIRAQTSSLATPFFSSRYTQVVGSLRPDSRIAMVEREGKVIAYLPFEQVGRSTIEPIGKAFNDVHGFICKDGESLSYRDVLRKMGFKSYRYHAMSGPVVADSSFQLGQNPSFLADLAAHPEGYVNFLETTRETIFKQRRKTKKMIRDLGPLRLEIDCRDKSVLDTLIALKRDQYQRTYIFDILGVPWAQSMMHQLWDDQAQPCRGLLSALYAGDTLVALHYGMIENGILHYWFPTYLREHHQYSPGTAIFLEIANQAPSLGIDKIDLGYGEQPYKHKFADTITQMPFGLVSCNKICFMKERLRLACAKQVKRIPGKPMLKRLVRSIWPKLGHAAFE
jgi:CelD/BcsL family acetyltransferase involved in cellulose biosynthesis